MIHLASYVGGGFDQVAAGNERPLVTLHLVD